MSFSFQSRKVINHEKALAFPLQPIPLNIVIAGVVDIRKESKSKDIIIENINLRPGENLYKLSSASTVIVDIMPVLNSLVDTPSSCTHEKFI